MILQYRGYNNVWCYEEAETICFANVWVGKETKDYRKGGMRYERKYTEDYVDGMSKEEIDMRYVREMHEAVDRLIKKEVHSNSSEIVYHISTPFDKMENVCVVTLLDKNKNKTYVFDNNVGVYLLNNNGQTVQRIS